MVYKSVVFILFLLLGTLISTGCSEETAEECLMVSPPNQELSETTTESVPSAAVDDNSAIAEAQELSQISIAVDNNDDVGTGLIDEGDANPYGDHLESLTFWKYYIFELFRGATEEQVQDRMEYSSYFATRTRGSNHMKFEVSYPRFAETSPIAEQLNSYYLCKIDVMREKEAEHWEYAKGFAPQFHPHTDSYSHSTSLLYTWGNIYAVIINERDARNRLTYTPLCDNFSLNTGERLSLDDIFTVDYRIYSARISESIKKPETDFKPLLDPWYEDEAENGRREAIPLPSEENFMLTPNGLAFIYRRGEIASMAEDAVILYVEYEDIIDILNVDLIFGS